MKSVDDGACLYYKLTHEPKGSGVGSGELKCSSLSKVLVQ